MLQPTAPMPEAPVGGEAAPEETEEQRAQRMGIIEAFSEIIKGKRKDAITARKASGIEAIWTEDEEFYDGIDNANRDSNAVLKGRNTSDGLTTQKKDTSTRSTVFLKVTRPYVDAAAARVSDMLLPTDDRNFALRAGKVAELTKLLKDMLPAEGQPQAPAMQPPQAPAGGLMGGIKRMFGGGQEAPAPVQPAPTAEPDRATVLKSEIKKAKDAADRAQDVIDDYLTECRYHAEVRKVIEGAAKVGAGILKGPHPSLKRSRAAKQGGDPTAPQTWTVEMVQKIAPTSKFINHWNFFPDGSCGDDIQKGSHTFECDDITARGLLDLKLDPTYIGEAIDRCIDEGPTSPEDGTRKNKPDQKTEAKDLFQIWYFHGQVSKKEMEAAGCKCEDGKQTYPAMVTMVNDHVIKVTLSPLDSGEFPYDVMVWQARNDHWAGVGVARQMRECQKGANAAVRNLMDNAGLSAGPQIIIDRSKIEPANGRWELSPRKVWYTRADEDGVDVNKAFMIVNIETLQTELMAILQFWLKEAEDVTGLPMLLQGQQGSAPDTVGGMQIMNNNGSTVLRRIARTFDDRVTEPHIGRYYEWLLLYGPDDAKGDFAIDARGSSALVERDLQAQSLPQLIALALNPAYGLDPELVIEEVLKSMRLDTKQLKLSDEKKAEIASRPPPEDPRITAANIMAKVRGDETVAKVQVKKMELDHDGKEGAAERELKEVLAGIEARLQQADLASDERQHLEKMKLQLAATTITIRAQENAQVGQAAMDLHKHRNPVIKPTMTPAAEPPGRAAPGQSFTQ